MNYVGKLLSNFKGFYNEINSATLTGAIDVIIIKQEDGSYVSSPFHVRFGKLGVMRSREKCVDIEINGEPVELHMKLGEAGEAFFVHEACEETEIPPYLATSPICDDAASLMEQGISMMRRDTDTALRASLTPEKDSDILATRMRQSASQTEALCDDINSRSRDRRSLSLKETSSDDRGPSFVAMPTSAVKDSREGSPDEDEVDNARLHREDSIYYSTYDMVIGSESNTKLSPADSSNRVDMAIQTDMSGPEIEQKAVERIRTISSDSSIKSSGSLSRNSPNSGAFKKVPNIHTIDTSDTSTSHKSSIQRPSPSSRDEQVRRDSDDSKASHKHVDRLRSRDSEVSLTSMNSKHSYASQASVDTTTHDNVGSRQVKKLTKKRSSRPRGNKSDSSDSLEGEEAPEGGMFNMDDLEDENQDTEGTVGYPGESLDREIGGVDKQQLTEAWARSQFAATKHAWSDADITPITSPLATRPPSPKSDTEYETNKFDSSAQTLITGTGEELNKTDDIKWEWGEVPQPATQEQGAANIKGTEPPAGLFQFMRKTKKIRHQPETEGIYLEDLNLTEMDPEVAALYLYGNKRDQGKLTVNITQDEDSESGRGASLPHSPVSMDLSHPSNSPGNQSVFRPVGSDTKMPHVEMSLCGGLPANSSETTSINNEKFSQYLINYTDFSKNPSLINDPNLVVKISDKYYNWQMAAPIVMSYMSFSNPLPDKTVDDLVKQHRPKKESRRRHWYWWGGGKTNEDDTPTTTTANQNTEPETPPIVTASRITPTCSPTTSTCPERMESLAEGESGPAPIEAEQEDESNYVSVEDVENPREDHLDDDAITELKVIKRPTPKHPLQKSNSTSQIDRLTSPQKKYAKSLKLSSDEIEKLHLREGMNVATFSVTTQYQGTAKCDAQIFLWNYDDKLIISDIDGTITRSDVWGHVLPLVGKDWSQIGITSLYNQIQRNGYKFIYLSARAIGQSSMTRAYLQSVRQENDLKLPIGPLLLSPSSLFSAFHKEVIERKPQEFKIGCLKDIRALFPVTYNPFIAGFGNKINDVWAYQEVGVPIPRIFTVNHRGELRMETVNHFSSSYKKLSDIVDMFFPPLLNALDGAMFHGRHLHAADFSSFTYWREPMADIELEIDSLKEGEKKEKK